MTSFLTTLQQLLLFSATVLLTGCVAWPLFVAPGAVGTGGPEAAHEGRHQPAEQEQHERQRDVHVARVGVRHPLRLEDQHEREGPGDARREQQSAGALAQHEAERGEGF